ncbi:MAG TPA: hypothetical protein ENK05_02825 [Gammaproteobacteria bacterium]|nr:hypothetical protein [Gammaproteobacteria bacterium]
MRRLAGGLCLWLLWCTAYPLEQIQLHFGTIADGGWSLQEVELVLDVSDAKKPVASIRVGRARFPGVELQHLAFECSELQIDVETVACAQGRLGLSMKGLSAKAVPAAFHYDRRSGALELSLSRFPLAAGRLGLALSLQAGRWQARVRLARVDLDGLAGLLTGAGMVLPPLEYAGRLGGELSLEGGEAGVRRLRWDLHGDDGGWSNADGSQAAEALQLDSRGSLSRRPHGWYIDASLRASAGMLFSDPLYLEFAGDRPLSLSLQASWNPDAGRLQLERLSFDQPQVVAGHLSGRLQPAAQPLQHLELEIERSQLPGLYQTWLQPWFAGTVLDDLETQGQLQGSLRVEQGRPRALQLRLEQVSFREAGGQFGVEGLNGRLQWSDDRATHRSTLAWRAANFYRLRLGAATLQLESGRRGLRLRKPLVVPFLDGQLHLDEFQLGVDDKGVHWLLDAMLTPVSMRTFSTALGWKPLSGKLSGMVPRVQYRNGVLTLGGILLVQAFDGDITVRNLRIEHPLGRVPRLWADVRAEHVDLKTLTRTFDFGRIEGQLRGEVKGLYMEAWQPVAFDAFLATPEGDRSRHRISQKAVDNLSDLGGGGVGGALSRSFLRVFEDFPYRRLGIGCRLENGVCHMRGVGPAPDGGYYLVEGAFLPHLDVIGHVREVDWQGLLDRLIAVTTGTGEGPEVSIGAQ